MEYQYGGNGFSTNLTSDDGILKTYELDLLSNGTNGAQGDWVLPSKLPPGSYIKLYLYTDKVVDAQDANHIYSQTILNIDNLNNENWSLVNQNIATEERDNYSGIYASTYFETDFTKSASIEKKTYVNDKNNLVYQAKITNTSLYSSIDASKVIEKMSNTNSIVQVVGRVYDDNGNIVNGFGLSNVKPTKTENDIDIYEFDFSNIRIYDTSANPITLAKGYSMELDMITMPYVQVAPKIRENQTILEIKDLDESNENINTDIWNLDGQNIATKANDEYIGIYASIPSDVIEIEKRVTIEKVPEYYKDEGKDYTEWKVKILNTSEDKVVDTSKIVEMISEYYNIKGYTAKMYDELDNECSGIDGEITIDNEDEILNNNKIYEIDLTENWSSKSTVYNPDNLLPGYYIELILKTDMLKAEKGLFNDETILKIDDIENEEWNLEDENVVRSTEKGYDGISASVYKEPNGIKSASIKKHQISATRDTTNPTLLDVTWNIEVTNTSDNIIDASKIIENIDKPLEIKSYTYSMQIPDSTVVGSSSKTSDILPSDNQIKESYTTYEIDLLEDWEGKAKHAGYTPEKLLPGCKIQLVVNSKMTEENFNQMYNTAVLPVEEIDTENWNIKNQTRATEENDGFEGIKSFDYASTGLIDGIKHIEKGKEKNAESRVQNTYLKDINEENQKVKFTLEMDVVLDRSINYKNAYIDGIIVYDLVPEQELGYSIDTNSYKVYIERADGTEETIEPDKYSIVYSDEILANYEDNNRYLVDFSKARTDIWSSEYTENSRSYKVTLDDSIRLENSDKLFIDYEVEKNENVKLNKDYKNILAYTYDVTNPDDRNLDLSILANTSNVNLRYVEIKNTMIKKSLYDILNKKVINAEEIFKNFDFEVYNKDDEKIGEFTLDYGKEISFEDVARDNNFELVENGQYKIVEKTDDKYKTAVYYNGYKYDGAEITFNYSMYGSSIEFRNTILKRGNIDVRKIDEEGYGIYFENMKIKFKLLDENKNVVNLVKDKKYYYYTEDTENVLNVIEENLCYFKIKNLPMGKYYIQEIEAPEGYKISNELTEFEIGVDDYVVLNSDSKKVDIKNERIISGTELNIIKADEKGEIITLDTAEFEILNQNDEKYKFVKTEQNERFGNQYRIAKDEDTDTVEKIETFNGKIQISNLDFGTEYKIKEVKAPWGYSINEKEYTVFYGKKGIYEKSLTILNELSKYDAVIEKVDDLGKTIKDVAKFELYDSNGNKMNFEKAESLQSSTQYILVKEASEKTTDIIETYNGRATLINLNTGENYVLKEKEAPEKHEYSEEEMSIYSDTKGDLIELKFKNNYIPDPFKLSISKRDEYNKVISSSESKFKIYKSNEDNAEEYKFVDLEETDYRGHHYRIATEEDVDTITELETYKGYIYIDGLDFDTNYYVKEFEAPYGYSLSDEVKEVRYSRRSEAIYSVIIKDKYNLGTIELTKVDSDDNKTITFSETEFELYDLNGELLKFKRLDNDNNTSCYIVSKEDNEDNEDNVTSLETYKGKVKISDLQEGNYQLKEIKAPENYRLNDELIDIEVKSGNITRKNISNDYIDGNKILRIEKIDYNTKELITYDEARFKVSKNNINDICNFVDLGIKDEEGHHYRFANDEDTDVVNEVETYKGKIKIYNASARHYVLNETKSPYGYRRDRNYYGYTIKKEENEKTIKFMNNRYRNRLLIYKYDKSMYRIRTGTAKFEIRDEEGNLIHFKKVRNHWDYSIYSTVFNDFDDEGVTTTLETYRGGIQVQYLIDGKKYYIREIEAPEGYKKSDEDTEVNIAEALNDTTTICNIQNGKDKSDIYIEKTDVYNKTIISDQVAFELYDENDNLIKLSYSGLMGSKGRIYTYDEENNNESRIITKDGKIEIQSLPIGNYYLKEVVAPKGYSLVGDKVAFEVKDSTYLNPPTIKIKNPEYKFGQEKYVSSSYQKIEEKDLTENYAYGYNGKESDYAQGIYNYIMVDSKEDIITYSLNVANMSMKNFEKIVIINKLADINDTGAVNLSKNRDSEFTIKLAEKPNFKVYTYYGEEETLLSEEDYTIKFTDAISYTNGDWNGKESSKWYDEPTESTNAFRVVFRNGFELPPTNGIRIEFDADIQDNARYNKIAWNSFGYRYYVGDYQLTAEPPKVGVKIPTDPVIYKTVTDGSDGIYTFIIYEKDNESNSYVVNVKAGDSAKVPVKRTINGVTTGYIEAGKTYIIKEATSSDYKLLNIKVIGENGRVDKGSFEFTQDEDKMTKVEFINGPVEENSEKDLSERKEDKIEEKSEENKRMSENTRSTLTNSTKTGDNVTVYIALVVIAVYGIVFVIIKKKEDKK